MKQDQFLWISAPDRPLTLISNDHIASVFIANGSVSLHLSNGSTFNVDGDGRLELLKTFLNHTIGTDGQKPTTAIEAVISRLDEEIKAGE